MTLRSSLSILGLSTVVFAACALGRPTPSVAAAPAPAPVQAAAVKGNPATGAKLFIQCRACHTVDKGGKNGVGPNLSGVMGAKVAFHPGYNYSPAMARSRLKWTTATMDAWLKRPAAVVPGNKMAFPGMANPQARADMIAYLETLK
ncbi:MAG: cytochrome c family protein [Alphaproteobacteria bacterium HGW-Alphaproteobacteria-16]|nr:MAG: cytochrome c family protein [Alphaproteobacteria bacterium HGW-Alphaproteobacteria-16]